MSESFKKPDFSEGKIELRYENEEMCIYGTREGLQDIIKLCQGLLDKGKSDHIHLEDYVLLTSNSIAGAIALFD